MITRFSNNATVLTVLNYLSGVIEVILFCCIVGMFVCECIINITDFTKVLIYYYVNLIK